MPKPRPAKQPSKGGRPPGPKPKVVRDVRHKPIDADLFMQALLIMAEDLDREQRGLPPLDDDPMGHAA